jgi:hypothetical protein
VLRRLGSGGLVAAVALTSGLARAQDSPNAVAAAWTDAWNSHDAAQVAALFTADGTYEDLAFDLVAKGTA